MDTNTKHFIHIVCVVLVLVGSFVQGASADNVLCRGIVTGVPDFGGAVGADGVNIRIDEIVFDQSGNLTEGDNVTVTWPVVPPFVYINAAVGDRVEVCGEYYKRDEMPDGWSNVGDGWIGLTNASDHHVCIAEFNSRCRGIVTGVPDFGGAVGADGVNIRIDEIVFDQSGNLTEGDNVTVTWPVVPPFDEIDVEVGDRVEVYGECHNITEMPDWWLNVKEHWIDLTGSEHYVTGLDIRLTGIATEYIEAGMSGAPYGWNVSVHEVISEQQLCSSWLNVTTQAVEPPRGYVDQNITEGDRVCVYGSYYNDSDGCGVSLVGSNEYYLKKSSQWNAVDAVIALRIAASGESCVEQDMQDLDVSSDGRVTSLDALMILKAALGRIQLR